MLVENKQKIKDYYEALVQRKKDHVGVFFVGVKTTSIFCIATCRARKPKFENVEFYTTFKDALDNGYRPCKICKPTENTNETPPYISAAIKMVKDDPKEKVKDHQLRNADISPEQVRRWFKKNYGITFHTFQRMYRINCAYEELKKGKKISSAAHDNGYESLSGFGYTYKKLLGRSPKQLAESSLILLSRTTTPIGPMFLAATDYGICMIEFVDRRMLETEFKDLQRLLKSRIITGENNHIKQAKKELKEYFEGKRKHFDMPLDHPGTEFQNQVWNGLKDIPYGETWTYQEQATHIKNPKAVRAVGTANGCNRISIVVPCHRVIGKDGNLTGYGGGLERKRWLLDHEQKNKV